jgi:hypothetical protein
MASQLKTVGTVLDELPSDTLHSAMARAFAEIEAATKDSTNPHFKSKYADLGSVIGAIKPPLVANGLFFTQRCQPAEDGVSVETMLHHRSGEKESLGILYVPANKRDPQGFGSALTYARRYALQTAFGVPTEDDDGNAASRQPSASTPAPSGKITDAQRDELLKLAEDAGVTTEQFCAVYNVKAVADLPASNFDRAKASLLRRLEKTNA